MLPMQCIRATSHISLDILVYYLYEITKIYACVFICTDMYMIIL